MELQHIAGNTYYIDLPNAVGVYIFEDHSCLLIDSGKEDEAAQIIQILKAEGLKVYGIVNTHCHPDHCGGNKIIQDEYQCKIYASYWEGLIIQHPILVLYFVYSATPPLRALKNKFLIFEPSLVTDTLETGVAVINGTPFKILDLKGHSLAQIGIETPDQVAFIGDSLINPNILNEYSFLFMADVEGQLETLDILSSENSREFFLSHGGLVTDVVETISKNRLLLEGIIDFILQVLKVPQTRENLISALAEEFKIPINQTQYYMVLTSVSAFLSHLCNTGQARVYTDGNMIKFSASRRRK